MRIPDGKALKFCSDCKHYYKKSCNNCGFDWGHNVRLVDKELPDNS